MKVIEQSDDYLVLGDRPWIISTILAGMVLLFVYIGFHMAGEGDTWEGYGLALGGGAFAALFFAMFVRRSQVIFDRRDGRVTLRSKSVFGYTEDHVALDDVERALVQTMRGEGETHRPALVMRCGPDRYRQLMEVYSSGSGADRAVEAINAWLGALDSEHDRT